jgi:hypothetical protein
MSFGAPTVRGPPHGPALVQDALEITAARRRRATDQFASTPRKDVGAARDALRPPPLHFSWRRWRVDAGSTLATGRAHREASRHALPVTILDTVDSWMPTSRAISRWLSARRATSRRICSTSSKVNRAAGDGQRRARRIASRFTARAPSHADADSPTLRSRRPHLPSATKRLPPSHLECPGKPSLGEGQGDAGQVRLA